MMHNQEINIITGRKQNTTSRLTNKEKIYNTLLEQNEKLTTTEISQKTKIDIKNISRYLKALESEGLIIRTTIQEGKRRLVYIKIKDNQNIETITSRKQKSTNRIKVNLDKEKSEEKETKDSKTFQSDSTSRRGSITSRKGNITIRNNNSGGSGAKEIFIPEYIKIAWKDLAPSISSAFSKRKWPTKNKMFKIFDNWFNELVEGE